MSLGCSFALTPPEVSELLAQADDAAREDWLMELEERDPPHVDFDKAWDALHRCANTFAGLLPANEVPAAAEAVDAVEKSWLRSRFDALDNTDYDGPADEDDFTYTWDSLVDLRAFLRTAAENGSAVVFTVSG